MVTLAHTTQIYDVEFEGKDYSVTFNTDVNIGYTDISVMEDGNPIEDVELSDRIVNYVQDSLSNRNVS